MKKSLLTLLLAGISCFVFSCGNETQQPANDSSQVTTNDAGANQAAGSPPPVAAADGKTVFEGKCTVCHGSDGKKGLMGAADLTGSTISHEAIISLVKNGKGAMTAFGGQLNEAEIDAVAKYVEAMRK
jgi:cytochrome c6